MISLIQLIISRLVKVHAVCGRVPAIKRDRLILFIVNYWTPLIVILSIFNIIINKSCLILLMKYLRHMQFIFKCSRTTHALVVK